MTMSAVPVTVAPLSSNFQWLLLCMLTVVCIFEAFPSPISAAGGIALNSLQNKIGSAEQSQTNALPLPRERIQVQPQPQARQDNGNGTKNGDLMKSLSATDLYCTRITVQIDVVDKSPSGCGPGQFLYQLRDQCCQDCEPGYQFIAGVCWNSLLQSSIAFCFSQPRGCPDGYHQIRTAAGSDQCYANCQDGYDWGGDIGGALTLCYRKCPSNFPYSDGVALCSNGAGAATPYGQCPYN